MSSFVRPIHEVVGNMSLSEYAEYYSTNFDPNWSYTWVLALVVVGCVALVIAAIMDCYRPGATHDDDGTPYRLNRECCGQVIHRGLVVPMVMLVVLGVILAALGSTDDLCKTPMAYCRSISCISGTIMWQGYVYMFVMLSLIPVLLISGIMTNARKQLCCVECYALSCGQYDLRVTGDGRFVTAAEASAIWFFICGATLTSLTAVIPAIMPDQAYGVEGYKLVADILHNAGIWSAQGLVMVSASLLAASRCRLAGACSSKKSCCCVCPCGVDKSATDEYGKRLGGKAGISANAWAGLGYAIMAVLDLLSVATYVSTFSFSHESNASTNVCILNTDQDSCQDGAGCLWVPEYEFVQCVLPHCDQMSSIAVTAEYLALCAAFAQSIILMPALLKIVAGGTSWNNGDVSSDEDESEEEDLFLRGRKVRIAKPAVVIPVSDNHDISSEKTENK